METGNLDDLSFFFFFGLHLILGGKLDDERREDLFIFIFWVFTSFWRVNWTSKDVKTFFLFFNDIFSGNGNKKLRPPPLQISGHAPDITTRNLALTAVITKITNEIIN